MSRPFSYNDENFTVIGNVLFVHIIDNKAREAFEPVVEIPPAIFERLITHINPCFVSTSNFSNQKSRDISSPDLTPTMSIINKFKNKYYLMFLSNVPPSNDVRLYWSIYFLKDI